MNKFRFFLAAATLVPATTFLAIRITQAQALRPPQSLLEMNGDTLNRAKSSSDQVALAMSTDNANPGIVVTTQPGKDGYPGLNVKPQGDAWDLSQYGHVELHATNLGTKPLNLSLRVDNAGNWQDQPWNAEGTTIKPRQSGVVSVIFGYAYGKNPGYPLNSKAINNLVVFTLKSDVEQSYRIDSIVADGPAGEKPPVPAVSPDAVRIVPEKGFMFGNGVAFDPAKQLNAKGSTAVLDGAAPAQTLKVTFPANTTEQWVALKPPAGRWNLNDSLEVHVKVKNDGAAPLTPRARLETNGGPSASTVLPAPLAPGATADLVIPFIPATPIVIGDKTTENKIASNAVSAVNVATDQGDTQRTLTIQSIQATFTPAQTPDWLGKKPPVDGDWTKTLDDEFNGTTLDTSIWDVKGPNYWDKATHFSKDNVVLGGGSVKLHYEKKTGHNDDDDAQKQTQYQAGYLHTYNKWAQRYGYFEARMKLPKAPGLWPAFWMMPDRGPAAGPEQWRRQDTVKDGMEFDIMEHLTGWGPNRYNIAQHWDGYGKDHKSIGADKVYVQPDKDGYITSGALWTPGSVIYYCNGKEVARWENARVSRVPEMVMFTIPQGGWDNTRLDDAKLPADFEIDYVRVWQRKDLASAVDGKIVAAPAAAPAVPVTNVAPAP